MSGLTEITDAVSAIEMRMAVWKAFFSPHVLSVLDTLEMVNTCSPLRYNDTEIMLETGQPESRVAPEIEKLMLPTICKRVEFDRDGLFDSRGWAKLELGNFVVGGGSLLLRIAVPKPVVVSVSSFKLKHQLTKYGERWARLYCVDRRIVSGRFQDGQQVAERRDFPPETDRSTMFKELFSDATKNARKQLFTVSEDELVDAVIRGNVKMQTVAA